MLSLKSILAALAAVAVVIGSPLPAGKPQAITALNADNAFVYSSGTNAKVRSLEDDLSPILALLAPIFAGADASLSSAANNLDAAAQNAGSALKQAADGASDVVADTVAGAAQAIG